MKKNVLDYINEIYTGGYTNALSYVNSISPVIVEESGEDPGEEPSEPGEEPDSGPDYLCFTATGESTVGIQNDGGNAPVLFYSMDKKNWVSWDYSTITLNDGESVYFYGENPDGIAKNTVVSSNFTMSGSIAASGNLQTLLSKKGDRLDVPDIGFSFLFYLCSDLTTASSLILPATTIGHGCYTQMFYGCTSLTTPPALPATTLAEGCYSNMFGGCTSLTIAPELPATTLALNCYLMMFENCSSLKTAPTLPATTLADSCYNMMFQNCSNLQSVTTYVTEWDTDNTFNWLSKAGTSAENPTVYCPADSTIPSDDNSGIPTGWTRADLVI